jgi:predicted ATPase
MIKEIELVNFKSHKDTKISLSNLTVLCGSNGVGKSSLIQSLLLIREAYLKDKSFDILDLKSNSAKIGTANDVLYEFGLQNSFSLFLKFDTNNYFKFSYKADKESEKIKSFISLAKEISYIIPITEDMTLFNSNFQYIGAGRLGPQSQYPKDDKIVDVYKQISVIEGQAEYFVHFLDKNRDLEILSSLYFPSENNHFGDLYTQVTLWQKFIFNGANAEVQDIGKLGYLLKYSFDAETSIGRTSYFDAKNVGFGLTYTLPILVAVLSAKKNSLILIENPESHLHPSGIARLTELFCLASQSGIQIIIETHSDHIINGILVQSKYFEESVGVKGISRQNVKLYQFNRDYAEHSTIAEEVPVEENGRIYDKPLDFFDQIDNDLRELI